jgi:hypothetical protein
MDIALFVILYAAVCMFFGCCILWISDESWKNCSPFAKNVCITSFLAFVFINIWLIVGIVMPTQVERIEELDVQSLTTGGQTVQVSLYCDDNRPMLVNLTERLKVVVAPGGKIIRKIYKKTYAGIDFRTPDSFEVAK